MEDVENPEEGKTEKSEQEEGKTEMSIDNEPDKIDFSKISSKIKANPWMLVSIVLGIIVIVLLFFVLRGGITGKVISGDDAGEKIAEYLNTRAGGGVEYVSHEDFGNLYEIIVLYRGDQISVYVTKDGEYFVQGAVPITGRAISQTPSQQQAQNIPKSDKPKVELFVMTHCPYGTQAEKGIIPVFELLGDKIDGTIRFVHYFMHEPEEEETPIQVCIREEQADKYLDYLRCFLEEGDSDNCLKEADIDEVKLNSCKTNKAEDYYAQDSGLSQSYGVSGSPTLVINGQMISSGRSPAAYLETICSAFNKAPDECNEELSSTTPKSMWGWDESGNPTQAQC